MLEEILFEAGKESGADVLAACEAACGALAKEGLRAGVREACGLAIPAGRLVVSDDAKRVRMLQEKGIPALAYRHAKNAAEDFSQLRFIFEEIEDIDADSYIKAYQRLTGEPWDILETARLRIRETTVDDVDRFYELYADPSMTRYMEGLFANPEDEKRYMRDYIRRVYDFFGFGVWTVIEKKSGAVIGRAGFSLRAGFDRPEIGFLIGRRWQGKGYAREAVAACLSFGRDVLGFDEVHALVREHNAVSVHLLQSLGFRIHETVQIEEDIYGGAYPEEGGTRTALGSARRGTYLEMTLHLTEWMDFTSPLC